MEADRSNEFDVPASNSSGEAFSSAVSSYFRDIGRLRDFSVEERQQLAINIDAAYDSLRESLRHFVFVQRVYRRGFSAGVESENRADDEKTFTLSSLQRMDAGISDRRTDFLSRSLQLEKYLAQAETEFSAAGVVSDGTREKLVKCCSGYELVGTLVDELIGYAGRFRRMLIDSGNRSAARDFICSKFLLPPEEIRLAVDALLKVRGRLDELERQMVEAHLRLVISLAGKYRSRGVQFGDLIQEGNVGLLQAISRYDFKLGHKFSTYATYWIRNSILNAVAEQSRVVRLPAHMIRQIRAINWEEQRFIQRNGVPADDADIAEAMHMPLPRVRSIRRMAAQAISLQETIGSGNDKLTLESVLPDQDNTSPDQNMAQKTMYDQLYELIGELPDREQQILIMHFGLFGQKRCSLEEISEKFALTRERVRQLEIKVLKILRSPEKRRFLDGYWTEEDN